MRRLNPSALSAVAFYALAVVSSAFVSPADAALRVVSWNVASDVDRNNDGSINSADGTFAVPNIVSAVQSMAARSLAGNAQPIDVLSLQELYYSGSSPSVTLTSVVSALNAVYGAGTYAYDPTVNATTGFATGNGPNGLIYNTNTIKVVGVQQVGTPSSAGAARAPMRYQLQATGYAGANTFYVYGQHAKALGTTADRDRRTIEADSVRSNADALAAGSHAIYTGDFNYVFGSNEAAYQDMIAAPGTLLASGALAGAVGQAADPLTTVFTGSNSAYAKYYTQASDGLTGRFDLQLVTANTLATDYSAGLKLVPGTYTAFGNSYYTADGIYSSVLNSGNSILRAANYNTALTGYTQAMLQNLLDASDHLPVMADYVIAVPEPGMLAVISVTVGIIVRRRRTRNA